MDIPFCHQIILMLMLPAHPPAILLESPIDSLGLNFLVQILRRHHRVSSPSKYRQPLEMKSLMKTNTMVFTRLDSSPDAGVEEFYVFFE